MKFICKKQAPIVLDAAQLTYGRLCSRTASILLGKENIYYSKNKLTGSVVVHNLDQVQFTGKNKPTKIVHYKHSGYSKGLKKFTLESFMQKGRLIDYLRISIYKMMPKTHHTKEYIYKNVKLG